MLDYPNNPREAPNPPARAAVARGQGETPSERYLAKLADRTFLDLWSYPNAYIDKEVRGPRGRQGTV